MGLEKLAGLFSTKGITYYSYARPNRTMLLGLNREAKREAEIAAQSFYERLKAVTKPVSKQLLYAREEARISLVG